MKGTIRGFKLQVQEDELNEVQEVFDYYQSNFGFVPNLIKVLSESPTAVRSYWLTQSELQQHGLLTAEEQNIVQLSTAVENECPYCTAAHSSAGVAFFGSNEKDLLAIRDKTKLGTEKFDALRNFAVKVYQNKGRISDKDLEEFFSYGYERGHAVEVVTNIGVKVMSNLTNQLALTELDEAFMGTTEQNS